eukprot:3938830-Rhodomonas_salina.2
MGLGGLPSRSMVKGGGGISSCVSCSDAWSQHGRPARTPPGYGGKDRFSDLQCYNTVTRIFTNTNSFRPRHGLTWVPGRYPGTRVQVYPGIQTSPCALAVLGPWLFGPSTSAPAQSSLYEWLRIEFTRSGQKISGAEGMNLCLNTL